MENRGDPPTASTQTIAAWQIKQTDQHDIISGSENPLVALQPKQQSMKTNAKETRH
jgi:hypothetical protein